MRLLLAAALLVPLSIAGCVAPPADAPPPRPPVAPPPPPPPPAQPKPAPLAGDWQDWPLTPGTWRYTRDAGGTRAVFGQGSGAPQLSLRCDLGGRRVILSRPGTASGAMTIRTSSSTRAVPVQIATGASPSAQAVFTAREPLLDAMAFSRGRIAVQQQGAPTLVLPTYAEIGRVIEDCRA